MQKRHVQKQVQKWRKFRGQNRGLFLILGNKVLSPAFTGVPEGQKERFLLG